jgi:hypothetical protein
MKFLIRLTIFYYFLFAVSSIFYGLIQLNETGSYKSLIIIFAVAWPIGATHIIVLLHVLKATPYLNKAAQKEAIERLRSMHPVLNNTK